LLNHLQLAEILIDPAVMHSLPGKSLIGTLREKIREQQEIRDNKLLFRVSPRE
jgi:hypothetical protein